VGFNGMRAAEYAVVGNDGWEGFLLAGEGAGTVYSRLAVSHFYGHLRTTRR